MDIFSGALERYVNRHESARALMITSSDARTGYASLYMGSESLSVQKIFKFQEHPNIISVDRIPINAGICGKNANPHEIFLDYITRSDERIVTKVSSDAVLKLNDIYENYTKFCKTVFLIAKPMLCSP